VADNARALTSVDLVCDYLPIKPPFGEQPDQPLEPEQEVLHSMQFSARQETC
jgi:hypothetical protein